MYPRSGRGFRQPAVRLGEIEQSQLRHVLSEAQEGNHYVLFDALVACYGLDDRVQSTYSQSAMIWDCDTLMRRPFAFPGQYGCLVGERSGTREPSQEPWQHLSRSGRTEASYYGQHFVTNQVKPDLRWSTRIKEKGAYSFSNLIAELVP